MELKCLNVRNCRDGFVELLGTREKTKETRTREAWRRIQKALQLVPGDRVGIVDDGVLRLVMTYDGITEYQDRDDFRRDYAAHRVPAGSKFDYVEGKGKIGICLVDPSPTNIPVPKLNHVQGWRIVSL